MESGIELIELCRLVEHPGNANRMSKGNFRKLASHIGRTGRYEPVVVRRHPREEGCFEILNGHHRCRALRQSGHTHAQCVVWDVDDGEAEILLATLNRLAGRDDVYRKSELIQRLAERFGGKELAKLLPDGRKQIERLRNLSVSLPPAGAGCFAKAVVFFLSDSQKEIVDRALGLAVRGVAGESSAQRKAVGLAVMAEAFCERVNESNGAKSEGQR